MAICPFAVWKPISGPVGTYTSGPFKIVHHTTEGSTAAGAMQAFASHRSDPHFTIDDKTIYQHIDTAQSARSLRNAIGGVQTNRDSAVQIELVGFAHLPKSPRSLENLARLCRWLESEHAIPNKWPAGFPKPPKNGKDPGGHHRDAAIWDTQGGHYGHCHVPENTHWDPGYTADEVNFIIGATFDASGKLTAPPSMAMALAPSLASKKAAGKKPSKGKVTASFASATSTMPDHDLAPTRMQAYLGDLLLQPLSPRLDGEPHGGAAMPSAKKAKSGKAKTMLAGTTALVPADGQAAIDGGSVLSFVGGIDRQDMDDVLYSVQLAQRGASGAYDRFTETEFWYRKYMEILTNLGWTTEQLTFSRFNQSQGDFQMDQAALAVIAAVAMQNQLAILQQAISALSRMADADASIKLFDFHASVEEAGNFQIGAVQRMPNGALSMALGAFYFRCVDSRKRFLFFKWGGESVNFWTAAQRMTLNTDFYAKRRQTVIDKLGADADRYLADLPVGKP